MDHDGWHCVTVHNPDNRDYSSVADYAIGWRSPNYLMPAIPLQVKYDYIGCVNIDDVTDPDDPIIVWMYDSWTQRNV